MEDLASVADRAFVDAKLRMAWARARDAETRPELEVEHARVRDAARHAHAPLRARIASGDLRGAELRRTFDAQPTLERDHFVEEVLGIAYPPLEERTLGRELVTYTPSGYGEIIHALDTTQLGPGDRFLDIGAGLGKVVFLAALLTGAESFGLECDGPLVEHARGAAAELRAPKVRFERGDARDAELPAADVVFMYVPFTGETFDAVMARVAAMNVRFVCCAPLDRGRYSAFEPACAPCSWLQVYARA